MRKSIITSFLLICSASITHATPGAGSEFYPYAVSLANLGIIQWRNTESEYRLNEPTSRAEMAKIALTIMGKAPWNCQAGMFTDVDDSLGDLCGYVETAADEWIVSKSAIRFRPTGNVSRAESVKMLLRAKWIDPIMGETTFSDVPGSMGDLAWYVNTGTKGRCLANAEKFRPNDPVSRWESFKIATCVIIQMQASSSSTQIPQYGLVWADEFEGDHLDRSKWNSETGWDGWWNHELQNYTDNSNVSVWNGLLTIEARKEGSGYTSARLNTHGKASWTYGKIEARIKLPYGQGIWPAFWMLGENIDEVWYPNSGEIDIMELVWGKSKEDWSDNDAVVWGSLHRPFRWRESLGEVKSVTESLRNPDGKFANDFHVYGIEWTPQNISYSVDNKTYQSVDISSKTDGYEVFHRPFHLLLNIAVGGDFPGKPDETTVWPQKMQVDWVRVYQK